MPKSPTDIAMDFVSRIDAHDIEGLLKLMSENHRFVDGLGEETQGKGNMKKAWASYFSWFPDYHMFIERTFANRQWVALFGRAGGTYAASGKYRPEKNLHWDIPAAWKARVVAGLVVEWQVYADNEPVWKAMGVKRY